MKYFLRLSACLLLLIVLAFPLPALGASSTSVTPSAFSEFTKDELRNKNFAGKDLESVDFAKVELEDADFSNANLRGAVFNASNLSNANLSGVDFTYGFAYLTNFDGANLSDAIFEEAVLSFSTFEGTKIKGADFTNAVLEKWQIKQLCADASGENSKTGVNTRDSIGCR